MADRLSNRDKDRLKAWLDVLGRCLTAFYDELDSLGMVTDEGLLKLANIRSELNWWQDFIKKGGG